MSAASLQRAQDAARALRADNRALRAENAALRAEVAALRAAAVPAAPTSVAHRDSASPTGTGAAGEGQPLPSELLPLRLAEAFAPPAALPPAAPGRGDGAARAAPTAPCLPMEVWVRVCACLGPVDVFALARTCRAAHAAACSRGAWHEVDLSAVDTELQERHNKATAHFVVDLTQGMPRNLTRRAPSVAHKFAAFLAAHPAAASGITRLVLPPPEERNFAPVCELLQHCTSLRRLVNFKVWRGA